MAQIVAVTAELDGSRDLGSTVSAVRRVLDQAGTIPSGVTITMSTLAMILSLIPLGMATVMASFVFPPDPRSRG
jgi:hypothetical protein